MVLDLVMYVIWNTIFYWKTNCDLFFFSEFKFAFDKYSNRKIDSLGVEYDYKSVMHYGAKAFSRNGQPTIVARDTTVKKFGNSHLSPLDIRQAKLLYNCPG